MLEQLRAATSARHAALERQLALDENISRARYVRVMQGFDTFLAAWEPMLAALVPAALRAWFTAGLRGNRAAQDVRALGALRLAPQRLDIDLPDATAVFGTLYVIEGSALGAQVIAPVLDRCLGLTRDSGSAYFHGGSDSAAARWREFRVLLAQHAAAGDAAGQSACRAAQQTFDALALSFGKALGEHAAA